MQPERPSPKADLSVSMAAPPEDPVQERLTGLAVFVTFLTSAASLEFARALRDYVRRNRIKVRIGRSDGGTLDVDASGSDIECVSKISRFSCRGKEKGVVDDQNSGAPSPSGCLCRRP